MLSSADAIGKIQQLYMDGTRPVPYLTFMNIFNDLLSDPVKVVPKEPDEELREKFRAACMAVNVGVYDTEGRGEDRVREFKEKVLPLWQGKLSAPEFAKFKEILEGGMRSKFRKEQARASADTVTESAGSKTSDLLRRLGIAPEGEQAAAEAEPEIELEAAGKPLELESEEEVPELESAGEVSPEEPDESEVLLPADETVPAIFPSIDKLVAAVHDGKMALTYKPRTDLTPFARYRLGQHAVEVRLVEGNTRNYVIGGVDVGYTDVDRGEDVVDDMIMEMGYLKTDEFTYRRREGDFLLRIRVLAERLDMPCGYPKGAGADVVIQQLQKVHRDLGELLERMESGG